MLSHEKDMLNTERDHNEAVGSYHNSIRSLQIDP